MPNITLEIVEQSFNSWRNTRRNRAEPIPQQLWNMVSVIATDYKHSEICKRLGLSGSQFKDRSTKSKPHADQSHFVVAAPPVKSRNITAPVTLSISGSTRTLSLSIGLDKLGSVLPHFTSLL